ncbi:MAG: hypothetical protein M3483_09050, partial [Gemmatimonadota bacterium]|nr:hypothetical protein [Gemmatimonadota bacterium]
AYRNENLLQFNPLSLGLVVLIPALFARAGWASRAARLLAWGVAGISMVGLLLGLTPAFPQENLAMVAFTLPVHLGVAWGVARIVGRTGSAPDGDRPAAPRRPGRKAA